MLLQRVLTALAGIPIVLAAIWLGPPWITILAGAAAVIGVWEAYRMYHPVVPADDDSPTGGLPTLLGGVWVLALVLAGTLAVGAQDFVTAALAICVAGSVLSGLWMTAAWRGTRPTWVAGWLLAPPVYIGGALACAIAIRGIQPESSSTEVVWPNGAAVVGTAAEPGLWWLLLGILAVYTADSAAYFVGRLIGRHRMAPSISPGKTWEGAAGGLVGAVVAATLLGTLTPLNLAVWQAAVTGVILGIVSPAGDLLESKVKRWAGVKDSGALFPGHGGMLDRLDSLLPSFIVVYAMAVYFNAD